MSVSLPSESPSYLTDPAWTALSDADRAVFAARRDAVWPDLVRRLAQLYAGHDLQAVLDRVEAVVALAFAARRAELRALDETRLVTPDWFQRSDMVGYVCYTDLFAGSLRGITEHLDYLDELGVTYLHLMPLLEPRTGPNDGGYAVADYRAIDPRVGTMSDLRELAGTLRERGTSLVVDLVCNHTAREHEWARRAVAGEREYQDYYLMYPDRTMPDEWEKTLPEIFPDFAPGNFTWVEEAERWVWTTFNDYQWDLNYANPAVFAEMLDIICNLGNEGVEVVRLDAVAFMWKRLGTNCQNQPEAHLILQAFRAATRIAMPGLILLAEAIVSPEDLIPYFGVGPATNKECELAYHNVFMVSLWSALAEGDIALLRHTINAMPAIPSATAWLTYARLHDDIGWAITDENAAAVGRSGFGHRAFLSDFYSGAFPGSFAAGEVFQENPATGDRRISGSLASLAGLETALASGDPRLVDLAVARILLLHNLVLSFGGVPLIYMGDEIGLRNDHSYLADPDKADDNRWIHRPPMDWGAAARRHDPASVEGRIFSEVARLAALRAGTDQLHAQATQEVLSLGNDHVLALFRSSARGPLLVLANVTAQEQWVPLHGFDRFGPLSGLHDLVADQWVGWDVPLAPYQVRWIVPVP